MKNIENARTSVAEVITSSVQAQQKRQPDNDTDSNSRIKIQANPDVKDADSIIIEKTITRFYRVEDDQKLAIAQKALAEFSELAPTLTTAITSKATSECAEFVLQTLDCLRYGNSYVLFVNQDWHNFPGKLHPVHEALIASRQTKVVTLEYFNPELYVNAGKVPLLGRVAQWLWSSSYYQNSDRIRYARALEAACAKHGKPIAVTDIAHNTNYSLYFYLSYLACILGGIASLLNLLPDHRIALLPASQFLYHRLDTGIRRLGKKLGRKLSLGGMFDPEYIHWYEKFFLDLEDARRILATCGARQLVSEYPGKDAEVPSYILVNIPPAHGIRYAFHLLDPTKADAWARKIKQVVYGMVPNISPTVRTWVYKRGISQATTNSSQGTWVLISKRRVKLLQ